MSGKVTKQELDSNLSTEIENKAGIEDLENIKTKLRMGAMV